MSYPHPQGYGAYYPPSNDQNAYPARQSLDSFSISANTNRNQDPGKPSRYPSPSYGWPSQNQQSYSNVNGDAQAHENTGWRGGLTQQTAYDYRREYPSYHNTNAPPAFYGVSSEAPPQPGTQALSSLAYASGLEAAGLQGRRSPTSIYSQNRVSSPVQNTPQHHLSQNNRPNPEQRPRSSSQQQLSMSSAAGLAGMVNRKRQSVQQSPSMTSSVLSSYTQNRAASTASPIPTVSQTAQPGSASPTTTSTDYTSRTNSMAYGRQKSPQRHGNSTSTQSRHSAKGTSPNLPRSTLPDSVQNKTQEPAPGVNPYAQKPSTIQQTSSVANLVIDNTTQEATQSHEAEGLSSMVSNFIDPTQVFNPYHKEYERKKMEAAAADAEARRQSSMAFSSKKPEEREQNAASAKPTSPVPEHAALAVADTTATSTESQGRVPDTEVGNEIRSILERIQEFKNKDPFLFQKLWEDVGKPAGGVLAVRSSSTSPSLQLTQELAQELPTQPQSLPDAPPISGTDGSSTSWTAEAERRRRSRPNSTKSFVEDNAEGLPDRGRFPAERRNRGPSEKKLTLGVAQLSESSQAAPVRTDGQAQTFKEWVSSGASAPPATLAATMSTTHGSSAPPPTMSALVLPPHSVPPSSITAFAPPPPPPPPPPSLTPSSMTAPALLPPSVPSSSMTASTPPPHSIPPSSISVLTPQPPSVPPKSSGTVWPEAKRKSLSEAAVKALNADPENRKKGLTSDIIHDMLEQNPSYIDLCQMLEARGLKFHRGHFARHLLSHVPDLAPSSSQAKPTSEKTPSRLCAPNQTVRHVIPPSNLRPPTVPLPNVPPTTYGPPIPVFHHILHLPNPNAASVKPGQDTRAPLTQARPPGQAPAPLTPTTTNVATSGNAQPASGSYPAKSRLGLPYPAVPQPVPGSKEAMSRKRDFSELVDLTQLSDDEDYVMPRKQARLDEIPAETDPFVTNLGAQSHHPHSKSTQSMPPQQSRLQNGSDPLAESAAPLKFNPKYQQPSIGPQQIGQPTKPPQAILAKPLNRAEALRKSYYDPKTVARDVLIAAGRHPTERPLNAHLAGLVGAYINLNSDLSTFDWDTVDPGGPPMPRVQMVDIPAGPPKWKLGERGERQTPGPRRTEVGVSSEPISAERRNNPTVAAVQNSHARLSPQTKSLPQSSHKGSKSAPQPSSLRHSHLVDDHSSDQIAPTTPKKRQASSTRSPAQPSSHTLSGRLLSIDPEINSAESNKPMQVRRRGRPPGSKNRNFSAEMPRKSARPSGQDVVQSRTRLASPPQYHIYECQWRQCNAKLHNLRTLRRHVAKIHRNSDEDASKYGHTCWWKKCRTLIHNEDKTVTPKVKFNSYSNWLDHIEEDHMHQIGMEFGDGPSSSQIGKPELALAKFIYYPVTKPITRTLSYADAQTLARDRAKFLSDDRGRTVTPAATLAGNKQYLPDALVLTAVSKDTEDRIPLKTFLKAHGNDKMDMKTSAAELLKAVEVRKSRVGPGLDRGGCTLVNAERRATLIQNEGIARVVDDDY